MPYIYVDVGFSELESDDIKDELAKRGFLVLEAPTPIPITGMRHDASPAEQVTYLVERLHYALNRDDQGEISGLAADLCRLLGGRIL